MIGCLCIHGFTGAPYEVEPLVTFLKEKTDWDFRVPTLPGHGEVLSLKGIHYQQWIHHAEEELKSLIATCDEVYVIGFSMGGMIASFLAAQYPVDKLILLSAAAYYFHPRQLASDLRVMLKDLVNGNLQKNELFLRYKIKLTETPLAAAIQFRKLVAFIKPVLPQVKIPTLIAQGDRDGIVPPKSAEYLFQTIGSEKKKLTYIKGSKHHICHCKDNETLFVEVLEFLSC
ncbi:alpha/beta hydrolase [Bacillus sp. JJ1764]|uniref:alpha/beta hydrolase n=1 Tax=Bacillus sp. JJ1764 TaxID=3122964 RepID=UPI002FFFFFB1